MFLSVFPVVSGIIILSHKKFKDCSLGSSCQLVIFAVILFTSFWVSSPSSRSLLSIWLMIAFFVSESLPTSVPCLLSPLLLFLIVHQLITTGCHSQRETSSHHSVVHTPLVATSCVQTKSHPSSRGVRGAGCLSWPRAHDGALSTLYVCSSLPCSAGLLSGMLTGIEEIPAPVLSFLMRNK